MDKTNIALIASLLALIGSFTYIGIDLSKSTDSIPLPNYYCEIQKTKAFCYSLSSTNVTCYTLENKKGGKQCSSKWIRIPSFSDVKKWRCDTQMCIPID